MATTPKKKCPSCEKEFEQAEYYFHVQEEILKQLIEVNSRMSDMQEVIELTYTYMSEDEGDIPEVDKNNGDIKSTVEILDDDDDDDDITLPADSPKTTPDIIFDAANPSSVKVETPKESKEKEKEKKKVIPDAEFQNIMDTIKSMSKDKDKEK